MRTPGLSIMKKKIINLHTVIEAGDKDHIKKKLVINMYWYNKP